jgi:hypothetical protein
MAFNNKGASVSVLTKVEVKLGIGVKVLVGISAGVDEGSINNRVEIVADATSGEVIGTERGVGEDSSDLMGRGTGGRHAASIKPEARVTLPARTALFMSFLGGGDNLHELRNGVAKHTLRKRAHLTVNDLASRNEEHGGNTLDAILTGPLRILIGIHFSNHQFT